MQYLETSRHLWRVWLSSARASVVREMEFRGNFIAGLVRQILWLAIFIIFIEILFARTTSIAGWTRAEMFIVLALSRLIEGVMGALFVSNWMRFTQAVNNGEFDFYLLRPVPAMFLAGFRYLHLDSLGNVAAGIGLLIYGMALQNYIVSVTDVFLAGFVALLGISIYHSLLVIVAALVFRLERLESLWGFNELFSEPLTVPFDVFPSQARIALTYLLPIAFVVFVPAQFLTGRAQWWLGLIGLGLAVLFQLIAIVMWRAGLKRYSSASS